MIVVDASVATKWHLVESDSNLALAFLEQRQVSLCGPDVLAVEVCRALVTAASARRMDRHTAEEAITEWLGSIDRGEVILHSIGPRLLGHAVEIALDLGHPLTDCIYLALAIDLDAQLVTSDVKFARKALRTYPLVKLLADYGD